MLPRAQASGTASVKRRVATAGFPYFGRYSRSE